MHVPTAPALILGGLLAVAAVDAAALHTMHPQRSVSHRSESPLVAATTVVAMVPAAPRPPLPRAATAKARAGARSAPHRTREHRTVAARSSAARPRVARSSTGTTQAALDVAVRRLPGYPAGTVRWVVSSAYGQWGTADWYNDVVYISPRVPSRLLRSVVIHEWDHILSVRDYGGDVDAAVAAMNQLFGGSGLVGAERAADCMARLSGAAWTHYTACASDTWRAGARLLLAGRQL